jgi:hypothetical protein
MANIFRWLILWLLPDMIKGVAMAKQDIDEAFSEGHRPEDVFAAALNKRQSAKPEPKMDPPMPMMEMKTETNRVKALNGPTANPKKRR